MRVPTPESVPRLAHTAFQAAMLLGAVYGLFLLAGLAWALTVGCGAALVASVVTEFGRPRQVEPAVDRGQVV